MSLRRRRRHAGVGRTLALDENTWQRPCLLWLTVTSDKSLHLWFLAYKVERMRTTKLFINRRFSALSPMLRSEPRPPTQRGSSGSVLPSLGRNGRLHSHSRDGPGAVERVRVIWPWIPHAPLAGRVEAFGNASNTFREPGCRQVLPETKLSAVASSCFCRGPQMPTVGRTEDGGFSFPSPVEKTSGWFLSICSQGTGRWQTRSIPFSLLYSSCLMLTAAKAPAFVNTKNHLFAWKDPE